jgi:uncharacterized protein YbcI
MLHDFASDGGSDVAPAPRAPQRGDLLLAISNAVVRLHKQHFGKGPTKARTIYEGDVITCVLSDVYTRAERTLVERGRASAVVMQRYELQEAVREEFIGEIEAITGRKVRAFFSGNQADPDMSVEVFVLAPQAAGSD